MTKRIFIFSSGTLKREGNTLCFIGPVKKKFVPVKEVSSLYIFGEVTFNKRLLEFLSTNKITLHLFNYYGYYIGSFYPRIYYSSGFMILKQAEHYLDIKKRTVLAGKFIKGAIDNILANLRYYAKRGKDLEETINSMRMYLYEIPKAKTPDELMGIEGNARKEYYSSWGKIIKREDFKLIERSKRPPKNMINTLISFGNSMLYVAILSEIYKTHLDPRIGFLHTTNFRKFTLNLDVSEVFKPIIVDKVIFTLVNKKIVDKTCFVKEMNGIYLNNKGMKKFVESFEKKLNESIRYGSRKRYSFQRIIRAELYKIEKHLMDEKEYIPFKLV